MNFKSILTSLIFILLISFSNLSQAIPNADDTAQAFFTYLERSKKEEAYGLLAKGLSQTISFDQFDQFMDNLKDQWGRIESEETAVMPFHKRLGEGDFIPLNAEAKDIKRYIYNVNFEQAEINFDLTLVFDGSEYKIVWFSIWGSSVYLTPEINDKIQELFSSQDKTQQ